MGSVSPPGEPLLAALAKPAGGAWLPRGGIRYTGVASHRTLAELSEQLLFLYLIVIKLLETSIFGSITINTMHGSLVENNEDSGKK